MQLGIYDHTSVSYSFWLCIDLGTWSLDFPHSSLESGFGPGRALRVPD